MSLNMDSKMKDLLANSATRAVLEKHMGDLLKDPRIKMGMGFPMRTLFKMAPEGVIPPGAPEAIEEDLNKLTPEELAKGAPVVETSKSKGKSADGGFLGNIRRILGIKKRKKTIHYLIITPERMIIKMKRY